MEFDRRWLDPDKAGAELAARAAEIRNCWQSASAGNWNSALPDCGASWMPALPG